MEDEPRIGVPAPQSLDVDASDARRLKSKILAEISRQVTLADQSDEVSLHDKEAGGHDRYQSVAA